MKDGLNKRVLVAAYSTEILVSEVKKRGIVALCKKKEIPKLFFEPFLRLMMTKEMMNRLKNSILIKICSLYVKVWTKTA